MGENAVDPHLVEQLKKLQAKYNVMGQDLLPTSMDYYILII